MDITLPKRIDGAQPQILENPRLITVIGANGAGKSRFCATLMKDCGGKAYCLSALKAIYAETYDNRMPGSISDLFARLSASVTLLRTDARTEFDRLMLMLLHDEFVDLIEYKSRHFNSNHCEPLPKTKFDTVAQVWKQIFPKNNILNCSGRLLFRTEGTDDTYSQIRLSDGEKAVLYYVCAVLYAMPDAVIFVDEPETFMHNSITAAVWNAIEQLRPDCQFIYSTHNVDFASSRIDNQCVWVREFDAANIAWAYEMLNPGKDFSDELYFDLLGSRKPILFIEGDDIHSIDSKLYPLVFPEYTVRPMGSCDKVIEATRAFNDLNSFHNLDSHGIVDRDRRDDHEVEYLRRKKIMVSNVAEVENLFLLEGVMRAVALAFKKDPVTVVAKVKKSIFAQFGSALRAQALEHTRHRVKRMTEMRIDKRFTNINAVEDHMMDLVNEINPRGIYEALCREFHSYIETGNYNAVLRVYNDKPMLGNCNVATLCGVSSKDAYIKAVLNILKRDCHEASLIRTAIKNSFGF